MKKLLYILILISFSMFSQTESFDGTILETYWSTTGIFLTVQKKSNGEVIQIQTPEYLRYQWKFTVQDGTTNLLPPPLHITDQWASETTTVDGAIFFVHCSEPTTVRLFMREHRWDETDQFWYEQALPSLLQKHSIVIPNAFNLGINWAWDWYVIVTNESGQSFQSPVYIYKNKEVDEQILRDNEPNQG